LPQVGEEPVVKAENVLERTIRHPPVMLQQQDDGRQEHLHMSGRRRLMLGVRLKVS
jgi:hypothetical protein